MTQLDAIVNAHENWLHPSLSFRRPAYRPLEPMLRRHIEHLRPDWSPEQVSTEVALWLERNPPREIDHENAYDPPPVAELGWEAFEDGF
jgi:hypothetical protein